MTCCTPHESGSPSPYGGNCRPRVRRCGHSPVRVFLITSAHAASSASSISAGMRSGTTTYPCSSKSCLSVGEDIVVVVCDNGGAARDCGLVIRKHPRFSGFQVRDGHLLSLHGLLAAFWCCSPLVSTLHISAVREPPCRVRRIAVTKGSRLSLNSPLHRQMQCRQDKNIPCRWQDEL